MTYKLPELKFEYQALEPYMDAKTIEIHYGKHHATYLSKLNAVLEDFPQILNMNIEEILRDLTQVPESIRTVVRNNGGGYYHHNLWWEQLSPDAGKKPMGVLAEAIETYFGGYDSLKEKLSTVSLNVFGSGWGWLCKNIDNQLVVTSTPNQDSPVSEGLTPIIAVDVWEHAYYLKFQNRRADFIETLWNLIDWEAAEKRFL